MISKKDVARVAHLARLSLEGDEAKQLADELSLILKHFEQVSKVNTMGVEPLVTPTDMQVYLREDSVVSWQSADAAMTNAPEKTGNLFKVPPVVG